MTRWSTSDGNGSLDSVIITVVSVFLRTKQVMCVVGGGNCLADPVNGLHCLRIKVQGHGKLNSEDRGQHVDVFRRLFLRCG
jgi:hypothetical protein